MKLALPVVAILLASSGVLSAQGLVIIKCGEATSKDFVFDHDDPDRESGWSDNVEALNISLVRQENGWDLVAEVDGMTSSFIDDGGELEQVALTDRFLILDAKLAARDADILFARYQFDLKKRAVSWSQHILLHDASVVSVLQADCE